MTISSRAISSRVARKPIVIPAGVEIKLAGADLSAKGPKGQLTTSVHPTVEVLIEDNLIKVLPAKQESIGRDATASRHQKAITGTARANIANLIRGVFEGIEKKLLLVGVGYRALVKGSELHLTVGFSHPVVIKAPDGIVFESPAATEVLVKGLDKHLVGHIASKIRAIRPPEPYKGKGIRYSDEKIELKETKKK